MFLINNSLKNITRNKKKYVLLIVVIGLVSFFSFISLIVLNSSTKYLEQQKEQYGSVVSIDRNMESMFASRNAGSRPGEMEADVLEDSYATIAENSEYVKSMITKSSGGAMLEDDITAVGSTTDDTTTDSTTMRMGGPGSQYDVQIEAYSDYGQISSFGVEIELYEGEYPTNKDEIVVSAQFATQNNLEIGDTLNLTLDTTLLPYKIVGLTTDTSSTEESFNPMNNSANQMYMTTAGLELVNATADSTTATDGRMMRFGQTEYIYILNSYKDIDNFTQWLYDNTEATEDTHTVDYANSNLESIITPIVSLTNTLKIYLTVTAIIGGLIILFIIQLNFKDRSYEIGVLRALNMSKTKLLISFVIEIIGATVIAFVAAVLLSLVIAQPIGSAIINSSSSSSTSQMMQGGPGMMSGNEGGMQTMVGGPGAQIESADMSDLTISIDPQVVLLDLGVILLLVVVASLYGLSYVYRYNPNKILKERG